MVIQWKTYASLVSTLPKSIYDETAGNSDALSLKWFFWISTQPFAIMFAPWRSQKSLPQTLGSDYWQLIHYGVEIKTWMFLYFLWSKEFLENNYYAKIGFVVFQIWLPPKIYGIQYFRLSGLCLPLTPLMLFCTVWTFFTSFDAQYL